MTGQAQLAEIESVKSQDSNTNRPAGSRRFAVPGFLRIWGRNNTTPQSDDIRNATASPAPLLPIAEPLSPTRPEPVATPSESHRSRRQRRQRTPLKIHWKRISLRFWVDQLLDGIEDGGNIMKENAIAIDREEVTSILRCLTSGLFLIILVTVYLALSMTHKVNTREMNIMLILVVLFAAAFFFHGLIRLCLLIIKSNREAAERANRPPRYRAPRYAVPPVPIPVVLAQDEEAVGMESEATKTQPPAYGRWRETVRVDPDRLFWQRNEAVDLSQIRPNTRAGPRPPSYVSEDGISYVVEAQPRSTAPTTEVPLPTHPSELGRVARVPTE
ncbi:hypothetical protein AU210_008451 [Fusarium oxysporum f. sp. radicis-cucumerinum]|uniref:Uncharacterized protein n=1 Tax=Fusarium oxysporum f. sp. radicis-cucumerinum TaxID=327505 RepID=A0A2H3GZN4_FUSOX|nr:hypothetical protein AU210_008451 [Fusarium oxysporum f. sp. radicis-cucumerinum]